MRRILLLAVISTIFVGCALALMNLKPSLTSKVMATHNSPSLKFRATPSPKHRFNTVQSLVERSPEIVVGVPISKSSYRRSPTDRMIFTDYEVQVLENLKGNRQRGRKINLRVPGGFISLQDGKTVEVTMPDFWKSPEIGKGYVFFLTRRKNSPYVLVGGPQGAFEISPWPESFSMTALPDISQGRVITPLVRDEDELMRNNKDKDMRVLLEEIKGLVGSNQQSMAAPK